MTWISPQNFTLGTLCLYFLYTSSDPHLAMVTGFYGGVGFNPWATFDWNVSGTGALVTPFWASWTTNVARLFTAASILWMYYGNYAWAQYMPMTSNQTFDRFGKKVSNVHPGSLTITDPIML